MRLQAYVYLGWSPILAVATDGARRVLQVTGWEGGSGTAPATGLYVGATGYVALIADGVDISGGGGGGGGIDIQAGTNVFSTGTLNFSNSNGVSFGINGSTLTASHNGITLQTAQTQNMVSLLGSTGNISFANSNGITFGGNNSTITASYTVPSTAGLISAINLSAGTTSNNLSAFTLSNGNGVSFGLNGSVVTATVATNYQSQGAYLTTAMQSNAATISNINLSAGTTSNNLSAMVFSNSNGMSFGLNGSTITGSYTVPTQTNQNISLYGLGNTTQNSSTVLNASNLSFNAIGSITVGYSNGSIQLSAANALTSQSNQAVSANNGSFTFQTLSLSNANGISFGTSAGSAITASYTVPSTAGLLSAINVSAGTTSNNLSAITYSNSNGISFGLNGSVVTATVATNYQSQGAYLTTAMQSNAATISNINVSAGTTSNNLSALTFSNLNGVSFGLNGSVITASVAAAGGAQTGISGMVLSNTTYTSGTVSYVDGNGISWASTTGQGISITHALQFTSNTSNITSNALNTSASRVINIIAATNNTGGGTASLSSNVSFSNANNFTFYTSAGGAIVGSFSQSVDTGKAGTGFTSAGNNIGLSGTLNTNGLSLSATVAAQSNQNISLFALGNTTQNSSTLLNASNLSFNGLGIVTVGYSNGSIQLSASQSTVAQNVSLFGLGNTTQNSSTVVSANALSFNAIGSLTVGYSNGSIQLSAANALTSQSNQAFSAAGGASNFQTLSFADTNNVSWTNTNGSIGIASVKLSMFAVSNTTQSSNGTANHTALSFAGAGVASVGITNGTVVISVPAGGGGGGNYIAAGTRTAGNNSTVLFSNSNNITWGLDAVNGSVLTASFNPINLGVSTLGNTLGTTGTLDGAGAEYIFVGGNNITLSQSLNGQSGTVTIIGAAGGGGGGIALANSQTTYTSGTANLIASGALTIGSTTGQSFYFSAPAQSSLSGTGKLSISVNGSTISLGVPNDAVLSSYENIPIFNQTMTLNGASISQAVAFNMPENVSASFMRIPVLMTMNSTTIATLASASASASGALYSTWNAVIYSVGSGASSRSLQSIASGSNGWTFSQQISMTNSTQASYSLGFSANAEGAGTTQTTQYSVSNTNYSFSTNMYSAFSSNRMLDIAFNNSLPVGQYWLVLGYSSSSASAGAAGLAALTNCNAKYSANYGASLSNIAFGILGSTNLTSGGNLGAGSFSTAGGGTTTGFNMSAISSHASHNKLYFQLLRSA